MIEGPPTSIMLPNAVWPIVEVTLKIDYPDILPSMARLFAYFVDLVSSSDLPRHLKDDVEVEMLKRAGRRIYARSVKRFALQPAFERALDIITSDEWPEPSLHTRITKLMVNYTLRHQTLSSYWKYNVARYAKRKGHFPADLLAEAEKWR